jgi:hypothetical protein
MTTGDEDQGEDMTSAQAVTDSAQSQADLLIDTLESFFREACQGDERLAKRLMVADTTWAAKITDADRGYTIYLDRFPIEFSREPDPAAEVTVFGDATSHIDAWTGFKFMGLLIAEGQMQYEGPVRKVLRIVPMFRPLARFGNFRELFRYSSRNHGGPEDG